MFPSTSTPFPFDTCKPTLPPLSFLHFPPPPPPSFEDHEIFHYHTHPHPHHDHDLFLLHHPQEVEDQSPCVAEANNGSNHSMEASRNKSSTDEKEQEHELEIPVRGGGWSGKSGSCKRDRHSKIKTARGLRDRRMRLSLQVAKRFFGLQDMLGFDKASKTVEWLLNHSKDEIKQLAIQNINHHHHHLHAHDDHEGRLVRSTASSTNSECEGVSGLDEVAFISSGEVPLVVKRGRASKGSRKRRSGALLHPIIGRESRQKARERARERTKEKEKMKSHKLLIEAAAHDTTTSTTTNHFNNNLTQFCSWNPFEAGGSSQESGKVSSPSLDVMLEPQQQQRSSQSKDDDSLVINIGKGSPSMIFSSFNYSAFLQEHQFAEFQSLAKLWEAYNNHMI